MLEDSTWSCCLSARCRRLDIQEGQLLRCGLKERTILPCPALVYDVSSNEEVVPGDHSIMKGRQRGSVENCGEERRLFPAQLKKDSARRSREGPKGGSTFEASEVNKP